MPALPLRRTGLLGAAAALCRGWQGAAGAAAGLGWVGRQRAERFTMPAHGGCSSSNIPLKQKMLIIWHAMAFFTAGAAW